MPQPRQAFFTPTAAAAGAISRPGRGNVSPTGHFCQQRQKYPKAPAETTFLHFLSALYHLSMQSCAPTQSAFSYPLSFRRLCQHSFPLPLPVATVNSFVLSCYGTTNISHPGPAGHTYPLRCSAPQWARFDNRHSTSAPDPTLAQRQRQRRKRYKRSPEPTMLPTALHARVHTAKFALARPAPRDP